MQVLTIIFQLIENSLSERTENVQHMFSLRSNHSLRRAVGTYFRLLLFSGTV